MEIGKWKLAQSWIHHPEPKDSRGVWDDLVKVANAEWKIKERDQRAEVLTHDFDELTPREEQYYQKPPFSTNEIFLGSEGGTPQLVQPGPGRQGYKGKKSQYNLDDVKKVIINANDGFKYYTYESLAKEIPGINSGSNLQIIIKNNKFPKLQTFDKKVEKAWVELFKDADASAQSLTKPLHKIRDMVGAGAKDYGTGVHARSRVEHISKALQKSKIIDWADEAKPLINKLSNSLFINKINKLAEKGEPWMLSDVVHSTQTKSMLRAPKTDAEHLMDYVVRHQNQAGGDAVFNIFDRNNPTKRITDFSNINSYHDIVFKGPTGEYYNIDNIAGKGRSNPLFREYFNLQNQLFDMSKRKHWPDGSKIIDPKTGNHVTFGNYSASMHKHGYGWKDPYKRFPYETDHLNLKKHPFKGLRILPQRLNIALGSVAQQNRPDLIKKLGGDYIGGLSIDDLMMQEKAFGEKILIFDKEGNHIGKKLETPYQSAKRMQQYYTDLDLYKKGELKIKPEFPMSEFQKPSSPVKKKFLNLAPPKSTTKTIPATFAAQFDDAIKSGKFKKFFKKFKGVGNILGGEVGFAVLDYINSRTKGQSHEKAMGKAMEMASFDIKDLDADEKAVIKHAIQQGASEEEVGALRNYLNYMKKYKIYDRANKMLHYAKENLGQGTGSPEDIGTTWEEVTDAAQNLKLREGELENLYNIYAEGTSDMQLGKNMLTKYMDSLAAEEWNKTAGTILDRGSRTHQGEAVVWNPIGALTIDIGGLFSGEMPTEFWDATVGKFPSLLDPRIKEKEKQIRLMERPVVGTDYPEYDLAREDMNLDFDYALQENYAQGGIASLKKK